MLKLEQQLWQRGISHVAGVDEAGRGPLAGPVVAAAVIFPARVDSLPQINDSKKLSARARLIARQIIEKHALAIGIGVVPPAIIDEINILQATFMVMKKAIENLEIPPQYALIDGKWGPKLAIPSEMVIKGDGQSMSIAAASIIAKVTRDEIMIAEDKYYPQYGFARHKGYPTSFHIEAIRRFGYSDIHRRSFHVKRLE